MCSTVTCQLHSWKNDQVFFLDTAVSMKSGTRRACSRCPRHDNRLSHCGWPSVQLWHLTVFITHKNLTSKLKIKPTWHYLYHILQKEETKKDRLKKKQEQEHITLPTASSRAMINIPLTLNDPGYSSLANTKNGLGFACRKKKLNIMPMNKCMQPCTIKKSVPAHVHRHTHKHTLSLATDQRM